MKKINIAVFASGTGSNALNLYRFFEKNPHAQVTMLVCNKPDAPVIELFKNTKVITRFINKEEFINENFLSNLTNIDLIVLAGFLWLIPPYLVKAFHNRIINIHPSLLPKFGGKGMYGMRVHKAVINSNEKESGITIHLVNQEYDKGQILFQKSCLIDETETPETLAKKINELELEYFPLTVNQFIEHNLLK